ncbi:MAG: YlbF family regulator [Oscillospiraceae bacterium]|nr:YlbF family regulator [Oscillospiraceae bacterium]
MADLLQMAKELGKALQKDAVYLAFRKAAEDNDNCEELQNLIGDFNLKKLNYSNENDKPEPDTDRLNALDKEVRDAYAAIMRNESMVNYQKARAEFEQLLDSINRVIAYSAAGQDPDQYDPTAAAACNGNCAGCAGCH